MDDLEFNLYERVRLPGRREGFVLSMSFPPNLPGEIPPPDELTVLTDDYRKVDCWAWQATKIRRARGQTVKSKDPKGSFYQVELDNDMRLRMGIWHDHWDRFPPAIPPGYYASYWEAYSSGNKVSLPASEDIRGQAPVPPQKLQQPRMF